MSRAPSTSWTGVQGVLPGLRSDPVGTLSRAWSECGDVVRLQLGPPVLGQVGHLLVHPTAVEHVLVRNAANYQLSAGYEVLRHFLGDGLLTSHGEAWKRHRRMAQPVFSASRLQRVAPAFVEAAQDAVVRLAAADGLVDLPAEMARLTLDAVGRTLFGASTVGAAAAVGPALGVVQEYAIRTLYSPTPVWARGAARRMPTARARRYLASVRALDEVVEALVRDRVDSARQGDDLLGVLLAPGPEGVVDPRAVRDEVMTFLLAGHETTAAALTWTLGLLSRHPEVRHRLHEELDEVLDGRPVTQDDLPRLPQLSAVLKESLRLYPPAWMLERQAQAADVVAGFDVPAGSTVVLSPYLTHRHPDFWSNPEGFDPDRWVRGDTPGRGAFLPFGAGARQCIGGAFATLEASLMLATLLQRLRLDLAPGQGLTPVPRITLTAADGLRVRVTPRDRAGAAPGPRVPLARRAAGRRDAAAPPAGSLR